MLSMARKQFEDHQDNSFPCIRAPVHMNADEETMEKVGDSDLIAGFRMVIVVFDPSIIGEIEVNHVD